MESPRRPTIDWHNYKLKLAKSLSYILAGDKDVTEKATKARFEGIWKFIREQNFDEVKKMIDGNQNVLEERGNVGEIPLHFCFLLGKDIHIQMAWYMLENNAEIVSFCYELDGSPYEGENILHIAIVNQRFDLIQQIMNGYPNHVKKLLNARAKGSFFEYGQPCYYGEFPLAFAAATNQFDIFDFLLEKGSDIAVKDTNGNTILHIVVIHSLKEGYKHVSKRWIERTGNISPWDVRNAEGMTPFMLSAYLGLKEMFEFLLEERTKINWSYGPVTCLLYPLDQLDHDIASDSSKNALEIIVYNSHLELLTNARIKALLDRKWNCFGYPILCQRLFLVILYLVILSTFVTERQKILKHGEKKMECLGLSLDSSVDEVECLSTCLAQVGLKIYAKYYITFALVMLGAIWKGKRELNEIQQEGIEEYIYSRGSGCLENFLSMSYFLCMLTFAALNFVSSSLASLFLSLACLFAFSYLLFFLLAFRITGPMIIMVQRMLLNDVLRFFIVYAVFLFAFAHAFLVLDHSHSAEGIYGNLASLFDATLGEFDLSEHWSKQTHPSISVVLLVVFVVLVSIQLLNLLIAMMGDTYTQVNADAEKQWQLERARIIFSIEHEMTADERKKLDYAVIINGERYFQVQAVNRDHYEKKAESPDL